MSFPAVLRAIRLPAALMACVALTSCATMSENECMYADWHAIGVEDGARGRPVSAVSGRRKACADAGVTVNMDEYQAGRKKGLRQYCTVRMGLDVGRRGSNYSNVCPARLEPDFMHGYELGRKIHAMDVKVGQKRYEISQLEEDLKSDEISDGEKDRIHAHLRTLDRELVKLQQRRNRLNKRANKLLSS